MPWRTFSELQCRRGQSWGYSDCRPFPSLSGFQSLAGGAVWTTPLELHDRGEKFVVRAEVPDADEYDLDVSATETTLTIRGQRRGDVPVEDGENRRCGRMGRTFSRSITLPSPVNTDIIEATCSGGVLEISLPKSIERESKTEIKLTPRRA